MRIRIVLAQWPISPWFFSGPFFLMACGMFASTHTLLNAEFSTWAAVNDALHEALWIPGALLVALACLYGNLLLPTNAILNNGLRARDGARAYLTQGILITSSAVFGHVVGVTPILAFATKDSTFGHLNIWDVIIAWSGITLLSMIGFGIGFLYSNRFIAILAGVLTFGFLGLSQEPTFRPLGIILPVRGITANTRFETNPYTALFTALTTLAIVAVFASIITWRITTESRKLKRNQAYVGVTAVALLFICAFIWRPEVYVVNRPVPLECTTTKGSNVCLHKANEPARYSINLAMENLRRAGLSPSLTTLTDHAGVDRDHPQSNEIMIDIFPGPFVAELSFHNLEEYVAWSIAEELFITPCIGSSIEHADVSRALFKRTLSLAGYSNLNSIDGIEEGSLTALEIESLLQTKADEVATCSLSPSDIIQ